MVLAFFIERPIFAAVVALIICLAGSSRCRSAGAQYPSITHSPGHGVADVSRRRLHHTRPVGGLAQ